MAIRTLHHQQRHSKEYWVLHTMVVMCVLMHCIARNEALPAFKSWAQYRSSIVGYKSIRNNECKHVSNVKTLCQQCAKVTRSDSVYPLCCENLEGARSWCNEYVHFGGA